MPGELTLYHPREAMIAFAFDLINTIHPKLIANASDAYVKIMRKRLREGVSEREKVIRAAQEQNDELAHIVLMAEYDQWTEMHQMPPHSLVEYERWQRKHGPPKRRGGKWWIEQHRYIGYSLVIALIAERFWVFPTRSDGSKGQVESACSIFRVALKRRDKSLALSEVHLNRIWGKYGEAALAAIATYREDPKLLPHVPLSPLIRR